MDNISWTIPSAWSAVSGLGTSNIVVNTNGSAAGSNKVEVKFDAIASKMNNVGQLIPKKCASSELEASFSITSCRSVINYPPSLVNHPSSHSDNKTSFGNISLPPNNYNFASGGEHTLKDNFDFKASGNSSLNIFIENCDCDSEWHDPNLMGQSSVQINNPVLNFNKKDERISRQPDSTNIGLESKVVLSNIYPNPFKGEVRITNLSIETLVTIKIFTGDGVKVFEKEVLADANGQIALRLAALRSGLFIAWVKQKDEVNTFKILKLD